MELPASQDERTWTVNFHMGLLAHARRNVMLMVPALSKLADVQEAARPDLRETGEPPKKASNAPVNGAGAAGETKKKTVKCSNCDKMGHIGIDAKPHARKRIKRKRPKSKKRLRR